MINTLILFYYKLAEMISTIDPSASGMIDMLRIGYLEFLNTTDPGTILDLLMNYFMMLVVLFVIYPMSLLYRIIMGLVGQPVPVPWF